MTKCSLAEISKQFKWGNSSRNFFARRSLTSQAGRLNSSDRERLDFSENSNDEIFSYPLRNCPFDASSFLVAFFVLLSLLLLSDYRREKPLGRFWLLEEERG